MDPTDYDQDEGPDVEIDEEEVNQNERVEHEGEMTTEEDADEMLEIFQEIQDGE